MLVSGANAFHYEVLWTRMLSHVMGGSLYAFAAMLAAFLTGIALGGGLAGPLARDRTGPPWPSRPHRRPSPFCRWASISGWGR